MEIGYISTPFGGRSMSRGMLASQQNAGEIDAEASIDKWKLFRALCEARPMLGVTDRALAVLNALLSFYPSNVLSLANGLVVFPSNAQLALRAHGIAPATLRRHLAALVDANLLIRRDSPNGKRYARRNSKGEVAQAFGFSVAPLIARAEEICAFAEQVVADRLRLRITRERLTLCRRDLAKLIEMAIEEGAPGDWITTHARFRSLVLRIPRSPVASDILPILEEMGLLRDEVLNLLETGLNVKKVGGNESQIERHSQTSNPESTDNLEHGLDEDPAESFGSRRASSVTTVEPHEARQEPSSGPAKQRRRQSDGASALKSFPLGLVLRACPDIAMYGPGGTISSWRELMTAGVVIRSMLGVSASAYEEACETLGPANAATVMACMLERGGRISSAGGYLRDLTRRAQRGEFSIGPMLMALTRTNAADARKSA